MVKNTLGDLNNFLFEQLERLNDDELTAEEVDTQIKKAKVMTDVASKIIETHQTVIEAQKLVLEYSPKATDMTPLIEMK